MANAWLKEAAASARVVRLPSRVREWLFPHAAERVYVSLTRQAIARLNADINTSIISALPELERLSKLNNDGVRGDRWVDTIISLAEGVKQRWTRNERSTLEKNAGQQAQAISDFNIRQQNAVIKSAIGIDVFKAEPWLRDVMDSFISENVSLITGLADEHIKSIENIVQRNLRGGKNSKGIATEIRERFAVSNRRAVLIAQDQTNKFNGQLTMKRQQALGIEEYDWSTAHDERVRDEHAAREGVRFKWKNPPAGGHPGQAVKCRCNPRPVLDFILK